MILEGHLEDLNIKDLLQLLSLSKKSGTLSLRSDVGKGHIFFQNGQVIRAASSQYQEGLGQLLKQRGLVTQEQIDSALAYQKTLVDHQPLGVIFSKHLHIPSEAIEAVVARQLEKIVFSFFEWHSGRFSFALNAPECFGSAQFNPLDFMLKEGMSSERLVLKRRHLAESARGEVDETRLDRELVERRKSIDQRGVPLLRGMMAELENPEMGGGIILLILRYASEVMGRAIIFDLRGRQMIGLGQFGLGEQHDNADQLIRMLRLGVENGSLFDRVIRERRGIVAELGSTDAEVKLKELIGSQSGQVFVGPLLNDGKVVAVLFGDNYSAGKSFKALDSFQVFLSQAGLALEQALAGKTRF
jgi:acid phosphatase family membrane protein YuiD